MMTLLRVFCGLLVVLLLQSGVCLADLYSYVDAQGVCHYTNVPSDKRYKPVKDLSTIARLQPGIMEHLSARRSSRHSGLGRHGSYDQHINRIADRYQVDPHLVKAVIKAESDFNCYAVSSKGAQGLMQLMPATARDLRVADPFDPIQNIDGGTRYLRLMLNSYGGNLEKSLAAYNAGPSNVSASGRLPAIPETRQYVRKVLQHYKSYRLGMMPLSSSIRVGKLQTIH